MHVEGQTVGRGWAYSVMTSILEDQLLCSLEQLGDVVMDLLNGLDLGQMAVKLVSARAGLHSRCHARASIQFF